MQAPPRCAGMRSCVLCPVLLLSWLLLSCASLHLCLSVCAPLATCAHALLCIATPLRPTSNRGTLKPRPPAGLGATRLVKLTGSLGGCTHQALCAATHAATHKPQSNQTTCGRSYRTLQLSRLQSLAPFLRPPTLPRLACHERPPPRRVRLRAPLNAGRRSADLHPLWRARSGGRRWGLGSLRAADSGLPRRRQGRHRRLLANPGGPRRRAPGSGDPGEERCPLHAGAQRDEGRHNRWHARLVKRGVNCGGGGFVWDPLGLNKGWQGGCCVSMDLERATCAASREP
jgi:hypothetical protein